MKARLYARTGKAPKTPFTGQAKRVFEEITETPELAVTINDRIVTSETPFKTRQDPYRVTLYYVLVFKKQGLVAAFEPPAEATDAEVTETEAADITETEEMADTMDEAMDAVDATDAE